MNLIDLFESSKCISFRAELNKMIVTFFYIFVTLYMNAGREIQNVQDGQNGWNEWQRYKFRYFENDS